MNAQFYRKLMILAALAVGSGLYAADQAADAAAAAKAVADKAAAAKAAATATKQDQEKFNAQASKLLATREALKNQLKTATEEQKKAIAEKLKELGTAELEMGKQMRDEFRKLRQAQGAPGRN